MYRLLFDILRCVVNDGSIEHDRLHGLSLQEWEDLYRQAKRQGVTAVIFEKIKSLPKEVAPPKELVMQWMSHAMSIERQTKALFEKSAEFAELMAKEGMQTMVLKGLALSGYSPNPWYREYGDLDCYFLSTR